jgi:hypothetical protein
MRPTPDDTRAAPEIMRLEYPETGLPSFNAILLARNVIPYPEKFKERVQNSIWRN